MPVVFCRALFFRSVPSALLLTSCGGVRRTSCPCGCCPPSSCATRRAPPHMQPLPLALPLQLSSGCASACSLTVACPPPPPCCVTDCLQLLRGTAVVHLLCAHREACVEGHPVPSTLLAHQVRRRRCSCRAPPAAPSPAPRYCGSAAAVGRVLVTPALQTLSCLPTHPALFMHPRRPAGPSLETCPAATQAWTCVLQTT